MKFTEFDTLGWPNRFEIQDIRDLLNQTEAGELKLTARQVHNLLLILDVFEDETKDWCGP